jgi:hypothetical protein
MTAILIFLATIACVYGALQVWYGSHGRGVHQIDSCELPLALKEICQSETDPDLAQAQARYNEWIESEKTDALKARVKLDRKAVQKRLREARKLVDAQPKPKAKIIRMQREQEK